MNKFFFSFAPLQSPILSVFALLLRLLAGGMMLTHGIPKLMKFATLAKTFPDPLHVGHQTSLILSIGAEVGCSLLLIIGLFSRLATLPLMFTMLIATFIIHGADPFATKELAVLYLTLYIAIFTLGAGKYSLDARMGR